MGKTRDKRKKANKKKEGSSKPTGKDKTESKTERNAKKKLLKLRDQSDDEEDIEALIAHFQKLDAEKVAITEAIVVRPSPRVYGAMILHPTKESELYLFGGEFFDGEATYVYNDMFRYNITKNTWNLISSPNSPPPRSSHQMVSYKNYLYTVGGEFTSPSQNQFYHYKDMWRFNVDTNAWEQLSPKNPPSARSGHRVIRWKNKLVLFGGFYDTFTDTKYYNDLHILDLETLVWKKIDFTHLQQVPAPRSGFQMGLFENTMFVYGGYAKEKSTEKYKEAKGIVRDDMWTLDLGQTVLSWVKVKKAGIFPPPRSGMTAVVDKKRMIFFGGAQDNELDDDIQSSFFNDMYAFHMDVKKWFPIQVLSKSQKAARSKKAAENPNSEKSEEVEEPENSKDEISEIPENPKDEISENSKDSSSQSSQISTSTPVQDEAVIPSPRINTMMIVSNNILYLFGGVYEAGKAERALDDLYSLNLRKMETFSTILEPTEQIWKGEESGDEEEGDEDDDDDEDDSDDDSDSESDSENSDSETEKNPDQVETENSEKTPEISEKKEKSKKKKTKGFIEALKSQLEEFRKDGQPVPESGESLRDFFERTSDFWAKFAHEIAVKNGAVDFDEKSLRRDGFSGAEERYKVCAPVMQQFHELEQESKEADEKRLRLEQRAKDKASGKVDKAKDKAKEKAKEKGKEKGKEKNKPKTKK